MYKREGERFTQCNISGTQNCGFLIWDGTCFEAHIELTVFRRGSMTVDRYIREILEENKYCMF